MARMVFVGEIDRLQSSGLLRKSVLEWMVIELGFTMAELSWSEIDKRTRDVL